MNPGQALRAAMRRRLMPATAWLCAAAVLQAGMPAAGAAEAPRLSAADRADIARVEAYLNGLGSMRARFIQTTSNGGFAEGQIYLRRPGKLRIDYAPPAKMQIYTDGFWLIYVDTELEQANHVPLSATPARVLVGENIRLSGDITVTRVERRAHALRIHMVQTAEPQAGTLALAFSDDPLTFRQWTVVDAQGISTRVSLVNPEFNVPIDNEVFVVDVPLVPTPDDE